MDTANCIWTLVFQSYLTHKLPDAGAQLIHVASPKMSVLLPANSAACFSCTVCFTNQTIQNRIRFLYLGAIIAAQVWCSLHAQEIYIYHKCNTPEFGHYISVLQGVQSLPQGRLIMHSPEKRTKMAHHLPIPGLWGIQPQRLKRTVITGLLRILFACTLTGILNLSLF